MVELFFTVHVTQYIVVLRVAFSPGSSGTGGNRGVNALSPAVAGHAFKTQTVDVRHLRRIDRGQLRQHVLDRAEARSRTSLRRGRSHGMRTSQPDQQSTAMDFSSDLCSRLLCGICAWADTDDARSIGIKEVAGFNT